jgi:hypothetical protein
MPLVTFVCDNPGKPALAPAFLVCTLIVHADERLPNRLQLTAGSSARKRRVGDSRNAGLIVGGVHQSTAATNPNAILFPQSSLMMQQIHGTPP